MTLAAFKACFSDWRVIKTRAAVQLVFEIPIEQADLAYQALGGMPVAAREVWCGIARLNPESEVMPSEQPQSAVDTPPRQEAESVTSVPAGAKERRKFEDMAPPQQAGMLCQEESFQRYLCENYLGLWQAISRNGEFEADKTTPVRWGLIAAAVVRELCKVNSRSEITKSNTEWHTLVLAYRLWMRHPELDDVA